MMLSTPEPGAPTASMRRGFLMSMARCAGTEIVLQCGVTEVRVIEISPTKQVGLGFFDDAINCSFQTNADV